MQNSYMAILRNKDDENDNLELEKVPLPSGWSS